MLQSETFESMSIVTLAERFIAEGLYENIALQSPFGTTDLKSFLVAFNTYSLNWGRVSAGPGIEKNINLTEMMENHSFYYNLIISFT